MKKTELIKYLDEYLTLKTYKDWSKNWLQVDNSKDEINRIAFAVDASSYIFDKAIKENSDMIIVHHWLFWWFDPVITGLHYQRVSKLIKSDIALYWVHLPLDAHDEIWNNIWIINEFIKYFDLKDYKIEKFWEYHGETIWFWIRFKEKIDISRLNDFCKAQGFKDEIYNFWNLGEITSFSLISWWGWSWITEAKTKNYDVYLIWEAVHFEIMWAKEMWQSLILGWHYETETAWVRLLAKHLEEKFSIETIFIDEKY